MAALVGTVLGAAVGLAALVGSREPAPSAGVSAPSAAIAAPAASAITPSTTVVRPLALPPGILDADLSVMPDRYVNEPPPASFRLVVIVRGGIPALASVEPPPAITWTEAGLSYRLTSSARTLSQLVDIAGALR